MIPFNLKLRHEPRLIIVLALLIVSTVATYSFLRPGIVPDHRHFKEFPKIIGEWRMTGEEHIDDGSMAVLLVDDYIMRTYTNKRGETIDLYIGYFKVQREGKQNHSPRQCLPGGGWNLIEQKDVFIPLDGQNISVIPANLNLMDKGGERQLFLWWYQGRGRMYTSEYLNKLYLIIDSITKRRTDGALIRLNMSVRDSMEETRDMQIKFINQFFPLINSYIPD